MPLPSSINDLSTTPASNSPAGSESPTLTDDYLRYYASYIAALRDVVLSGTASLTTLNLAYTGTLTGGTGVVNIGSGQIYKDASGNVGIGTTSPSSIGTFAAVKNAAGVTVAGVSNSNSAASDGAKLSTLFGTTQIGAYGHYWTGSAFVNDLNFYSTLTLSMGATERMRIDSIGNVGIGTAAPLTRFDARVADAFATVVSSASLNANTNTVARFSFTTDPAAAITPGTGAALSLSSTPNRGEVFLVATNATTSKDTSDFAVWTTLAGTAAEAMRIDSGGNVGIGTASPGTKLDVLGNIQYGDATVKVYGQASAGSGVGLIGTASTYPFAIATNGTERLRIKTSGGVVFAPMGAPASPQEGEMYYDTTAKKHYGWNGTSWNAFY